MQKQTLLINGASARAADGRVFERRSPVTGEAVTSAAAAGVADAERAAAAAAAAFPEWSAVPPAGKRKLLLFAAGNLESRADDIVGAMRDEIGATEAWGRFNVSLAAEMLVESASLTTQIKGEIVPANRPGTTAYAVRRPVGVVLAIAPWNAPVILAVRAIAAPLACGNTVVLKSSELCPRTHALVAEAVAEGLPKGAVNALSNAPEDAPELTETLVAHPAVRRVNFTGSTRVGRVVAETAGRFLKPVLLELGGKAPLVVLDDADLDAAVAAAGFGAYMNQGQICMSTERIVVMESIADEFVKKFSEKVLTLTAGDPREAKHPLGALAAADAADRARALVKDAVDKGATLIGGGGEGVTPNAAALDRVTPDMRVYHEETFAPLTAIVRVGGIDDAVRAANDGDFGLSAAVFGRDQARAMSVARRIESGICHVNGPTVYDEAQMPFGGIKGSGYGRFGGMWGVAEFTEVRWMTVQDGPLRYPI